MKLKNFVKLLVLGSLFVVSVSSIIACGRSKKHQYITDGSVQLKLDYKNRNFFTDGIGQVKVETYIDGDTTHFKNLFGNKDKVLKSRYYGIDTPESTGNVQEYGKQASNFTHERLASANENGTIVISSPFSISETGEAGRYGEPEADSTGGRYLSLVWINETKPNCKSEDLYLLNLYIVQEGLSWAKNVKEVPFFEDTFIAAQNQAEKLKLKLWSGEPDPEFNYDEYQNTSLYNIKEELVETFKDSNHINAYSGANVRFTGVVSGYANNTLYVQEHFFFDHENKPYDPTEVDVETEYTPEQRALFHDEWAGINLFCGMNPVESPYSDVGTYLRMPGKATDSETFGFQIQDMQGKFRKPPTDDEHYVNVIIPAEENTGEKALKTFEYTKNELNAAIGKNVPNTDKNYEALFCRTRVTESLTCTNAYLNADGDELTLYMDGCDFNVYVPFQYHGNPDNKLDNWMDIEKVIGKTFNVSGVLGYHKTKQGKYNFQIICCDDSDLVCLSPIEGTTFDHPFTVSEAYEEFDSLIENVYYYVKGNVASAATYGYEHDNETEFDTYHASFSITDGEFTLEVKNAEFPKDVNNAINKEKTATDKQMQIDKYMTNFAIGSYAVVRGLPSKTQNVISYSGGIVHNIKLPGRSNENPASVGEIVTIAESLLDNGQGGHKTGTTELLYFQGIVTEITTPWSEQFDDRGSTRKNRMSFVIKDIDGQVTFEVYCCGTTADIANTLMGKTIIVSARFEYVNNTLTTNYNGCRVDSIINN